MSLSQNFIANQIVGTNSNNPIVFVTSAPANTNNFTTNNNTSVDYIFTLNYNADQDANNLIYYCGIQETGKKKIGSTEYNTSYCPYTQLELPDVGANIKNVTSMSAIGFSNSNGNNYNTITLTVAFYDVSFNSYLYYIYFYANTNTPSFSDWIKISKTSASNGTFNLWSSIIQEKQPYNLNSSSSECSTIYMIQTTYNYTPTITYNSSTICEVVYSFTNGNKSITNGALTPATNACANYQWYVPYTTELLNGQVGYSSSNTVGNIISIYNPMIAYFNSTFSGLAVKNASTNEVNVYYYTGNDNIITNNNINFSSAALNLTLNQPITGYCMNDNYIFYTYENYNNYYYNYLSNNNPSWTQNINVSGNNALQWIYYDNNNNALWLTDNNQYYYNDNSDKNYDKNSDYTQKSCGAFYNFISGSGLLGASQLAVSYTSYNFLSEQHKYKNSSIAVAVLEGENQGLWWIVNLPQFQY